MKTLLLSSIVLLAMGMSTTASADSWNARYSRYAHHSSASHARHYSPNRHWNASYGNHWNRFDRGYNRFSHRSSFNRHNNNYFSVSYGRGWNNGWRHRRHNYSSDVGILVGGIALGSLLSNAAHDRHAPATVTRTVYRAPVTRTQVVRQTEVVYSQPAAAPVSTVPNRRLLRDLQGNCFEITRNSVGDEVRVQLDPSECRF